MPMTLLLLSCVLHSLESSDAAVASAGFRVQGLEVFGKRDAAAQVLESLRS